jgi:exodeoxyribonuclease VII small subunit
MAGTTERPTTTDVPARPVADLTFDDALAELQRTIAELETGGQPLERTLALHERGAELLAHCETLLRSAELRMRQLVSKGGSLETVEVTQDRTIEEG